MPKPKYMNPSNAYWAPPQYQVSSLKPISGNLGFLLNLPYPDPVSGPFSFGEGNTDIYGKRELVGSSFPELYAIGNVLPLTGGIPRVAPNGLAATHSRAAYTVRV